MYIGDTAGIQNREPDIVIQDPGAAQDKQGRDDQDQSEHIVDNMDQHGADLFFFGADAADKIRRQAVTDIDAENDRENGTKTDADRTGDRHRRRDRVGDRP